MFPSVFICVVCLVLFAAWLGEHAEEIIRG